MTIDELMAEIEAKRPCFDGFACAVCQAGEPYVVIRSHGIHREAEFLEPHLYASPKEAVAALRDKIDSYLEIRAGTLYWRTKPHVEYIEARRADNKLGLSAHPAGWSASARLCITANPVIWATQEEYDNRGMAA